MASKIAVFPQLRNILKLKQIEFSNINKKKYGGCILDGRDIGTVILPKADFKFFITASIEIRAKRRLLEKKISCLQGENVECMLQYIKKDISRRDKLDKSRLISPLVPAKDAFIIDTSMIDANELMSIVVKIIEKRN
jgi:cytidylate kinase